MGADRVANAVAAETFYGAPAIVVDFGTATNIDVIDEDGYYIGGAIAPGIRISMDALAARMTGGKQRYDEGGRLAAGGRVSETLLAYLLQTDGYLNLAPPKTTGREYYGEGFGLWLDCGAQGRGAVVRATLPLRWEEETEC